MKIIEVKNLKKQFGKNVVLDNINLEIKKGEVVSLIGPSGSGKSTILRSIIDLETITSGDILIEGNNLKDKKIKKEMLLKTGMVFQTFNLFPHMSVRNNIVKTLELVKKLDKKEANKIAEETLEVVGLIDKIDNFPSELSGGQKQRLSIARAIARDPEIYIFDDSFSALDYKTDKILRKALKEYTKDATTLIVAQRIGTIMHADKIVVLDNGKCVGIGTHKELLKNCEVYKEIALSQLTKEELENA